MNFEQGYDIDRCFLFFQEFKKDFYGLVYSGVLHRTEEDRFEWKKKKTSLAEYFNWRGSSVSVEGGFWAPIEKSFVVKGKEIKRGSLTKLLAKQKASKLDSSDFVEIKNLLTEYRETTYKKFLEMKETLKVIKKVIETTENEPPDLVLDVYMQIEKIFSQKVVEKKQTVKYGKSGKKMA
jgi:hypothetical protein